MSLLKRKNTSGKARLRYVGSIWGMELAAEIDEKSPRGDARRWSREHCNYTRLLVPGVATKRIADGESVHDVLATSQCQYTPRPRISVLEQMKRSREDGHAILLTVDCAADRGGYHRGGPTCSIEDAVEAYYQIARYVDEFWPEVLWLQIENEPTYPEVWSEDDYEDLCVRVCGALRSFDSFSIVISDLAPHGGAKTYVDDDGKTKPSPNYNREGKGDQTMHTYLNTKHNIKKS